MSNDVSKFSEPGFSFPSTRIIGLPRELLAEEKRERAVRALSLASKPRHAHTPPALLIGKIDAIFNEHQATLDSRLDFHEFSRACRHMHELAADPVNNFFSTGPSALAAGQLSDAFLQDLFLQHGPLRDNSPAVITRSGWLYKR